MFCQCSSHKILIENKEGGQGVYHDQRIPQRPVGKILKRRLKRQLLEEAGHLKGEGGNNWAAPLSTWKDSYLSRPHFLQDNLGWSDYFFFEIFLRLNPEKQAFHFEKRIAVHETANDLRTDRGRDFL